MGDSSTLTHVHQSFSPEGERKKEMEEESSFARSLYEPVVLLGSSASQVGSEKKRTKAEFTN